MDVAVLLGELRGVIDRVAALDVSLLGAGELQQLVEGLEVQGSRLAAAAAGPLHVWETVGCGARRGRVRRGWRWGTGCTVVITSLPGCWVGRTS